ncbi:uncharacterized protein METZ01_LOCUS3794 [marine metagenome]|uniref:Uncharacterized protein n=1 Tax=marine metagenome TaxID=408172 RepID=A0A381N8I8_9ZZZZ
MSASSQKCNACGAYGKLLCKTERTLNSLDISCEVGANGPKGGLLNTYWCDS